MRPTLNFKRVWHFWGAEERNGLCPHPLGDEVPQTLLSSDQEFAVSQDLCAFSEANHKGLRSLRWPVSKRSLRETNPFVDCNREKAKGGPGDKVPRRVRAEPCLPERATPISRWTRLEAT